MSDFGFTIGKLAGMAAVVLVVMLVIVVTGVWLFVRDLPFFQ